VGDKRLLYCTEQFTPRFFLLDGEVLRPSTCIIQSNISTYSSQ